MVLDAITQGETAIDNQTNNNMPRRVRPKVCDMSLNWFSKIFPLEYRHTIKNTRPSLSQERPSPKYVTILTTIFYEETESILFSFVLSLHQSKSTGCSLSGT